MLKAVSPQKVEDDEAGFIVQVASRSSVEYIEGSKKVLIDADFGSTVGIYMDSIDEWITASGTSEMNSPEKQVIVDRVQRALRLMGSEVELC